MKKNSRVTIKEIAEAAGVSIAAVSLFLSGKRKFSSATNQKISSASKQLGYVPNTMARSLATRTSSIIGVMVPDIRNPFFPSIMDGISHYLSERGYEVFVSSSEESEERQKKILTSFLQYRLAGVIAIPTGHVLKIHTDFTHIEEQIPLVLIDRDIRNLKCAKVLLNNRDAAARLTSLLLEAGHTEIGIIAPPSFLSIGKERISGIRSAMRSRGLLLKKENIFHGDLFSDSGKKAYDYFFNMPHSARPGAILSCGDLMTLGFIDALKKRGLKIPKDISLVSFDDPDYFDFLDPPITCLAQPAEKFGIEAARLLTNAIKNEKFQSTTIRLKGEVKHRNSVRSF